MSKTTILPQKTPVNYIGDLDVVSVGVEYYTGPQGVHEQAKLQEYCEKQSRTPGFLDMRFAFDNRSVNHQRQYGLRWSFHNYTTTDILIIDRLGLPVTIKPEIRRNDGPPGLVIRKEMYFDTLEASRQAFLNAQSLGKLHGAELTRMLPELEKAHRDNIFGRHLSLEYHISEVEIREGDGRLYHLPSDLVVSFLSAADTIRHPCSPEYARTNNTYLPNYPTGELDLNVIIRYVCTDPKAPPKYVRVVNKVFMLKPEFGEAAKLIMQTVGKDKQQQEVEVSEYVELLYPAHMDALRTGVQGYRCLRVTLDEARVRFGIYDTAEEARAPLIATERIEQQHKEALASLAAEADKAMKQQHKKHAEQDDELRRQKLLIEELKRTRDQEMERLKEENDKATHRRRMSTETIKLVSVVATASVTLVGLYLKFKKKE